LLAGIGFAHWSEAIFGAIAERAADRRFAAPCELSVSSLTFQPCHFLMFRTTQLKHALPMLHFFS